MYTILLVVLVLLLLGGLPLYPYSRGWGLSPATILLVLLVLWALFGRRF